MIHHLALAALWSCFVATACVDDAPTTADQRAVEVRASGCSLADRLATGIDLGGGLTLTVAHVLRGSETVTLDGRPGVVVALDERIDAALVRSAALLAPAVFAASDGVLGTATLARRSGPEPIGIERAVTIRIDEPRGDATYQRAGLVLDHGVDRGDSGAGIIDGSDRVVGMVFATSRGADGSSYAVAASELEPFVSRHGGDRPLELGGCGRGPRE